MFSLLDSIYNPVLLVLIVLFVFLMFNAPALAKTKASFEIRGWDLNEPAAALFSRLDQAVANGINVITLSHSTVMAVEDITTKPNQARLIEMFAAQAQEKGIEVYLWTREITNPPAKFLRAGYLNFDHPELMDWLSEQYRELLKAVPSVSGVVLFFTEADYQIHRGPHEPERYTGSRLVISNLDPEERLALVINTVYDVMAEHGKRLIVRDFFRTPTEYDLFYQAMQKVPQDVMIYSRHKPNDFRYNYPPSPSLGRFPDRTHLVELELSIPGGAEYYQQEMQRARDLGINGFIARIRFNDFFREFNNLAYNRLLQNPDQDLSAVWTEYFGPIFEDLEVYQAVVEVLKEFPNIRYYNNYTLGFYLGKHNGIEPVSRSDSRLNSGDSLGIWTNDETLKRIEAMLKAGGPEIIAMADGWHSWGETLVRQCLAKLESVKERFPDESRYNQIAGLFEEQLVQAVSRRVWIRSYLALRYYRRNPRSADAQALANAELTAMMEFIRTEKHDPGLVSFATDVANEVTRLNRIAKD